MRSGASAKVCSPTLGWVRTLHSGSVEDRQIAAHQLGQADPKDLKMAVPALVAGLGDKNEAVRAAAAFALGNAGLTAMKTKADQAEAREAALALTRVLTDSDEDVRVTAAVALGHFANAAKTGGFPTEPGPMAVALVGLLDSPSLKVRKLGCQALAQISSAAPIEPPPSLIAGLSRWELPECRAIAALGPGLLQDRDRVGGRRLDQGAEGRRPAGPQQRGRLAPEVRRRIVDGPPTAGRDPRRFVHPAAAAAASLPGRRGRSLSGRGLGAGRHSRRPGAPCR